MTLQARHPSEFPRLTSHPVRWRQPRELAASDRMVEELGAPQFTGQDLAAVISRCDRVCEVCPEFHGGPELTKWNIPNPANDDSATCPQFQRTAAERATRVDLLLAKLAARPALPQ